MWSKAIIFLCNYVGYVLDIDLLPTMKGYSHVYLYLSNRDN